MNPTPFREGPFSDSTSILLARLDGENRLSDGRRYPAFLLDAAGQSETGGGRRLNQDMFRISSLLDEPEGEHLEDSRSELSSGVLPVRLLAVADGIGGAPAGERASALVIRSLHSFLLEERAHLQQEESRQAVVEEILHQGVERCQAELARLVLRHPEWFGMGTTLTAAIVLGSTMYMVHAGDSKGYLFREDSLRRLTHDHTQAQILADAGVLTAERLRTSRFKHVVWNTFGGAHPNVRPDIRPEPLRKGDVLLLCTDGLTDRLSEDDLSAVLSGGGTPRVLAGSLMAAARRRTPSDDFTVLVARYEGTSS